MNTKMTAPQDHTASTAPDAEFESATSTPPAASRHPLARRSLLRLLGATVIFGAIARFVPRNGSDSAVENEPWLDFPGSKESSSSRGLHVAEARRQLAELSKTYEDAQSREIVAARRGLDGSFGRAQRAAPDAATDAAKPFQGLSNMTKCAFRGAADRLDGGERLKTYSGESLMPVASLAVKTANEIEAVLVAVHQASLVRANRFHDDTLALARDFELEPAEIGFGENLARKWQGSLDDLFAKRTTAGISAALEIAMIAFTYRALANLLTPVIVKLAKTGSAAAIAAVADGPLPIGDVVAAVLAIGGTIWTVNDIRKAVKAGEALPGEIESALTAEFVSIGNAAEEYLRHIDQACGSAFRSVL